ncbi:spore maturation protein CgeB [Bradyrhizobium lablabi]|uniref:Spore maturation protein CgeB n=1 Tax=Bradyrhizobium lablabi TaxID=722472 RepID=A0A1M7BHJ5_9BRAD|nr:glycosyltransferase [Bradyrhizobium lablabi]SHL54450.1 spore maturation protein CgeB [Bradyrhizobium lablabi]
MKILCVLSRYAYGKPERGENYDYVHFVPAFERLGHEVSFFDSGDRSLHGDFADLNMALLDRVARFRPDLIFCVLMHYEIWFETLDLIRQASPAVVVNWGTDDSWKFAQASRFFAEHVDLHVTTDRAAAETAPSRGLGNVFLSQWAASAATSLEPCSSQSCHYDVSFVGSMYGYRAEWIAALRASGIAVSCFGHGTENGVVSAAEIPEIFRASRISLNFSGSGQNPGGAGSLDQRQIKARTFEVPGAGGFLLTEVAPELEQYFAVGSEIAVFTSPGELVEKARHYLDHPGERDVIARAGHARVITEHTYERRISEILEKLRPLQAARKTQLWALSVDALAAAVEQHRHKGFAGRLRSLLIAAFSLVFGSERGPRAARRFSYELSWRLAGATTYRARGLPGRLFYAES